jgi:uncharacterized surface protein with fasciclin (FAS1) repeats
MNKIVLNFKKITAIALVIAAFSSCEKKETGTNFSIAGVAVSNPAFSTLESAAIRGGVVGVLSNANAGDPSGKFTVFAPTNAAFSRLGLNSSSDLLVLNQSFLTSTLLYHVANGNLPSSAINAGGTSGSALGVSRRFINRGADKFVNGSKIVINDVAASNGTIHAIDKVLLATGADIANSTIALTQSKVFTSPELTFLLEAVLYCDLAGALSSPNGPYTVFAPNDAAFKQLGTILGVPLNKPSDIRTLPKATVTQVLLTHVFNTARFTSEMNAGTLTALNGQAVTLGAYNNGVLSVKGNGNGANVANMVIPDVQCTNGIVHVIDRVLLPM